MHKSRKASPTAINAVYVGYFITLVKLHRPCLFATKHNDPHKSGPIRKTYYHADVVRTLQFIFAVRA
jgi:hypothetical protein